MSGGRVELGLGAGWFEAEHQAYAIPFPPLGERFDRLTEQLRYPHRPVDDTRRRDVRLHRNALHRAGLPGAAQTRAVTASADHHRRRRPQAHPALAAKFAAEFNIPFVDLDTLEDPIRAGRASASPRPGGLGLPDLLGGVRAVRRARRRRDRRRAGAIGRDVDELRSNSPLVGTPAEIVDRLGAFIAAGVQRVYLQLLDMSDLEHLEFFATEVVPQLG